MRSAAVVRTPHAIRDSSSSVLITSVYTEPGCVMAKTIAQMVVMKGIAQVRMIEV